MANLTDIITPTNLVTKAGTETLTNKTLTSPALGTPSALVLTNATGTLTSPTFVTPVLGTPSSGTATNLTGLPAAGVVGTAAILGANTYTAAQTLAVGAAVASATTTSLTAATGNGVHITGTTTITAITLATGRFCDVIFDGILTLTHHTTTNNLPGAANLTTAAGDRATYWSDGTTVYCTSFQKADGTGVIAASGTPSVVIETSTALTATKDTHVTFTNASLTTITLPASPASGDLVWITASNALTTNIVGRNSSTIMDLAEDLIMDVALSTVKLRYTDSSWRLV